MAKEADSFRILQKEEKSPREPSSPQTSPLITVEYLPPSTVRICHALDPRTRKTNLGESASMVVSRSRCEKRRDASPRKKRGSPAWRSRSPRRDAKRGKGGRKEGRKKGRKVGVFIPSPRVSTSFSSFF